MSLFANLSSCQYEDLSFTTAPDTRLHCWVIHGRLCKDKKALSTYVTKVSRPEEGGDKDLYAEMTSEEELTYRSAIAMESEYIYHFP